MAEHFTIMADCEHEPPRETAISFAFRDVLKNLHAFIVAERDLEDVAYSSDPAYAAWAQEAELAYENLAKALIAVHSLPVQTREDGPLHRMALLVDAMIGHEEPGGARVLNLQMQIAFFREFQVSGISPTAMHRNGLLIHARHLVSAMINLPLFDGAPVDEAQEDDGATHELGNVV